MANENMQLSEAGYGELRLSEGVKMKYYNDSANHCTYGIGTLAHHGPCTTQELQTPVTPQMVNAALTARVQIAEKAVRRRVTDAPLSQSQFDALVSFVYNVGEGGAAKTLAAANRGAVSEVAMHMQSMVYVHPIDKQGRRQPAQRVQGLVNRRQRESAPFSAAAEPVLPRSRVDQPSDFKPAGGRAP